MQEFVLCLVILATRKRVQKLFEGHLFIRKIFIQLVADIFLDCFFVTPDRIHIVTATPKMTVPILVFQVCMTIKNHPRTFALQIPHELGYAQVRGSTDKHMDVVRTRLSFVDFHFLLLAKRA